MFDTTVKRKMAPNFLKQLIEVYHIVEKDWKTNVVAIVTDSSGEAKRARKDFASKFPSVVVLDCFAHQVSCYS